MAPTLRSHMSLAYGCAGSVGKQQAWFGLITSLNFTDRLLLHIYSRVFCNLRVLATFDYVHSLPVACGGLRNSQGEIMLSSRVHGSSEHNRLIVGLDPYVGT